MDARSVGLLPEASPHPAAAWQGLCTIKLLMYFCIVVVFYAALALL